MITAVSMVKNSADVIETMIRGNSLVVDNFVVTDNASNDNTRHILDSLIKEGYRIDIKDDDSISPYQRDRNSEAIKYATDRYHPDFIIPLDDDEIICSNNPNIDAYDIKECISNLDHDNLYYMNCRHYIPTDEDDQREICVALREKYCLDDEPDMTRKILIPDKIASHESFRLGWGAHFAECDRIKNRILLNDIRMAHYPIRSSVQIASKAINGWINRLVMPDRTSNMSIHWKHMYQVIKEYGLPSNDTMLLLANMYREHPENSEDLKVAFRPISIPDEVFRLKYTKEVEVNLFKNILENFERIASDYVELLEKSN